MSKIKNLHLFYATVLSGLVIIVVGAILINAVHNQLEQPVSSPSPTLAVNPTNASPGVSPTASTAVSPTPIATASPLPSPIVLPQSAVTFLANFYAAYNQQDRARLETYFTVDTSDLRSELFNGTNAQGVPGGPTLFTTSSADQHSTGYSIISSVVEGSGWLVTVQEQRVNGGGAAISPVTTIVTLVPGTGSSVWLIDNYSYSGGTGKYAAFITK